MEISEEKKGKFYVFHLAGRLDASTSPEFEEKLLSKIDEGENDILINFGGLDYISSSGLRVLLMGAKRVKPAGGSINLCEMKNHIYEVFEIAGFTPLFTIHNNCDT